MSKCRPTARLLPASARWFRQPLWQLVSQYAPPVRGKSVTWRTQACNCGADPRWVGSTSDGWDALGPTPKYGQLNGCGGPSHNFSSRVARRRGRPINDPLPTGPWIMTELSSLTTLARSIGGWLCLALTITSVFSARPRFCRALSICGSKSRQRRWHWGGWRGSL